VKVWEFSREWRETSFFCTSMPRFSIAAAKRTLPFQWSQPDVCIVAWIQCAFTSLCDSIIVNSNIVVSFHHDIRARIRDYGATAEQFLTSLYSNSLKRDRSFHILRFLHCRGNNAEIDRKADNFDALWKIRTICYTLNDAYENYYNPSKHLAADEIILKFKGQVVTSDCAFSSASGVPYKGQIQVDNAGAKVIYTSSRKPHKRYVHCILLYL
jgi:hypothetical protein